jgi:hypothetical protein
MENSIISFCDFLQLNENLMKLNKGTGQFRIKTKNDSDIFELKNLVKLGKETIKKKKDVWEFIKSNSHEFSLPTVLLSLIIMGVNVQSFISNNPEVLQYGPQISPEGIQDAVNQAVNFFQKNLAFIRSMF